MSRTALALTVLGAVEATYTVLSIGDSWGDTGPTYKIIADAFKKNGVDAIVKNRAIGGTTACEWSAKTKSDKSSTKFNAGEAMINAAKEEFGDAGPDFIWYTAGGNDLVFDNVYHSCLSDAKTDADAKLCVKTSSDKAKACTAQMFDPFFKAFPNTKVMQCNYDVPCENKLCDSLIVNSFVGGAWCAGDKFCINSLGLYWAEIYTQQLQKEYPQPQYTALNIFGTVQQANGIEGASPGHPVLDRDSGGCNAMTEEIMCIHPKYGSKMATAIGNTFWDMYFSQHVSSGNVTSV